MFGIMDCPECQLSAIEREGTQSARLFQCRHEDTQYMVERAAFETFVDLSADIQRAALAAARRRSGQAVPVIKLDDMIFANAWRKPLIETDSVKVFRPRASFALKPRNDR